MMSYIDHIKYRTMLDDPDQYFDKVKIVDFDIIHHECRGDKLIGNYKDYKTIQELNRYLKEKIKVVLSAAFRNKREDLWVKRDLMIKHFREIFK